MCLLLRPSCVQGLLSGLDSKNNTPLDRIASHKTLVRQDVDVDRRIDFLSLSARALFSQTYIYIGIFFFFSYETLYIKACNT